MASPSPSFLKQVLEASSLSDATAESLSGPGTAENAQPPAGAVAVSAKVPSPFMIAEPLPSKNVEAEKVSEAEPKPKPKPESGSESEPESQSESVPAPAHDPTIIAAAPAAKEKEAQVVSPPVFKAAMPPVRESAVENAGVEHFRILLDHAPSAMAMFDTEMRYLLANTRWLEDFKLIGQDVVGRCHYELFPTLHPGWRHVYQRALEGQVVRCDRDSMTQNGRAVVYRWEVRPWRQSDTTIGGIMITCSRLHAADEAAAAAKPLPKEEPHDADQLWDGAMPMLALDEQGRILRVSRGASTFLLPRGLQEGETHFWDVLGDRHEQPAIKERVQAALKTVLHDGSVQDVIRIVGSEATENDMMGEIPAHWLFTQLNDSTSQHAAVALVMGLEGAPITPPVRIKVSQESEKAAGVAMDMQKRLLEATDAEKLSRQRENRIRSVLDLMPCGLLVLDEKTQLIYQNPRLSQLLGREVTVGQRVEDWLLLGCRDEAHARQVQRLWQEDIWRRRLTQVVTLVSMDDLLKDIEIRPVALPGGGMMLMLQDITETRRSEEMLRSAEAKFRTLVHENPTAVVLTDRSGSIFDANPAAEILLGHPRAELRRMGLEQWLSDDTIKQRAETLASMVEREASSAEMEAALQVKTSGMSQNVGMRLALVRDASQQPLFTVHFLTPVPAPAPATTAPVQQKTATAHFTSPPSQPSVSTAWSEGDDDMQAYGLEEDDDEINCGDDFLCLENDPAVERIRSEVDLLTTDAHGRVVEWSSEAEALFGHPEADVRTRGLHLAFSAADETLFYEQLADAHARAKDGYEVTWNFRDKSGARKFATFVVYSIGDLKLAVRIARRVDIEKPREAKPKSVPVEPVTTTRRVDGKPQQPATSTALEQQRMLLGETHQRVKDHLQIINSMLNLQMTTMRNEEARLALRSSQNRIRSIAALHQYLSKVASGEETKFSTLAEGLVERLRECYNIPAERVAIIFDIPEAKVPEPWLLPLSLALNEMLGNVFKHAYPENRSGQVHLHLGWDEVSGTLVVSDDGVGLLEDFADRHHEGMGLKILRVFAGQLGGELRISSPETGGATFELQFPVNAHR